MENWLTLAMYVIATFILWGWKLGGYSLLSIVTIMVISTVMIFLIKGSEYDIKVDPVNGYIVYYTYFLLAMGAIYRCAKLIGNRKNKTMVKNKK